MKDCQHCGHTRAAHSFGERCHHVGCDCPVFAVAHRGRDHKGVVRACIQEIHWCWDEYEAEPAIGRSPI